MNITPKLDKEARTVRITHRYAETETKRLDIVTEVSLTDEPIYRSSRKNAKVVGVKNLETFRVVFVTGSNAMGKKGADVETESFLEAMERYNKLK